MWFINLHMIVNRYRYSNTEPKTNLTNNYLNFHVTNAGALLKITPPKPSILSIFFHTCNSNYLSLLRPSHDSVAAFGGKVSFS